MKYVITREAYNSALASNNNEIELNNIEVINNQLSEYKSKKSTIENIYDTFENRDELLQKLFSAGFLNDNKTLSFKNPLLGMHAKYSNNVRKSEELKKKISEYEGNLKDLGTISNDETVSETGSINEIITNLKKQLSELSNIITMDLKEVNDKINEMIEKTKT